MGSVRWLDEDEMRAWHSFLAAGALVDRRVDQQLKDAVGLSHPQYEILVRLAAAPSGELRMTELADTVLTSKSGLTYQVTQLEKAGLVARRSCPSDVRGVLAVLTEVGRRRLEQAAPGHVALVRELLIDVLSPAQLAVLADALGEVARRAAAPEGEPGPTSNRQPATSNQQPATGNRQPAQCNIEPVICGTVLHRAGRRRARVGTGGPVGTNVTGEVRAGWAGH